MGDYALSIVNDTGALVIDSTYANHAVAFSQSVTINKASYDYLVTVAFPFPISPNDLPLLMSDCRHPLALSRFITDANGNFSGAEFFVDPANVTSVSFDYAVLVSAAALSDSSSHGLVVYSASGARVFDSRLTYFNVKDEVEFKTHQSQINLTHAQVAKPFYAIGPVVGMYYDSLDSTEPADVHRLLAKNLNQTSVSVSFAPITSAGNGEIGPELGSGPNYQPLIVCELLN